MSLHVIKPITIFVSSIFYLLMTITVYIDNELVLAQYLVEIDAYKSAICRVIPHAIHVGTHVLIAPRAWLAILGQWKLRI